MRKPTLLIDFDGVMHEYAGWKGLTVVDGPIPGARAALYILERKYKLVCFTTRNAEIVKRWLTQYGFPEMKVTNIKEPAELILDDRAICFTGIWDQKLLDAIKNFQPHWKSPNPQLEESSL